MTFLTNLKLIHGLTILTNLISSKSPRSDFIFDLMSFDWFAFHCVNCLLCGLTVLSISPILDFLPKWSSFFFVSADRSEDCISTTATQEEATMDGLSRILHHHEKLLYIVEKDSPFQVKYSCCHFSKYKDSSTTVPILNTPNGFFLKIYIIAMTVSRSCDLLLGSKSQCPKFHFIYLIWFPQLCPCCNCHVADLKDLRSQAPHLPDPTPRYNAIHTVWYHDNFTRLIKVVPQFVTHGFQEDFGETA